MHNVARNIVAQILVIKELGLIRSETYRKKSQEDAKQSSHAMQSRYDTFREEAQYLAGGYDKQKENLRSCIVALRDLLLTTHATNVRVVLGSLVYLTNSTTGKENTYLLLPEATGGDKLSQENGIIIQTISVATPVAKILIGKEKADNVQITIDGITSEYIITTLL